LFGLPDYEIVNARALAKQQKQAELDRQQKFAARIANEAARLRAEEAATAEGLRLELERLAEKQQRDEEGKALTEAHLRRKNSLITDRRHGDDSAAASAAIVAAESTIAQPASASSRHRRHDTPIVPHQPAVPPPRARRRTPLAADVIAEFDEEAAAMDAEETLDEEDELEEELKQPSVSAAPIQPEPGLSTVGKHRIKQDSLDAAHPLHELSFARQKNESDARRDSAIINEAVAFGGIVAGAAAAASQPLSPPASSPTSVDPSLPPATLRMYPPALVAEVDAAHRVLSGFIQKCQQDTLQLKDNPAELVQIYLYSVSSYTSSASTRSCNESLTPV
jgi:hypothetical protein